MGDGWFAGVVGVAPAVGVGAMGWGCLGDLLWVVLVLVAVLVCWSGSGWI